MLFVNLNNRIVMKRFIISIIAIICIGISASAQQITRNFSIPNTPKSLELTYINHVPLNGHDGTLEINNPSDQSLKVHVVVSVIIKWTEQSESNPIPQRMKKTLILCDDDFDIAKYERTTYTHSKRGVIKGGPHKPNKTYEYNIEVTYK